MTAIWQAECLHPKCRVLSYAWTKAGDSCPACGWGSIPVDELVDLPAHKEFVQ